MSFQASGLTGKRRNQSRVALIGDLLNKRLGHMVAEYQTSRVRGALHGDEKCYGFGVVIGIDSDLAESRDAYNVIVKFFNEHLGAK